MKLWRLIRQVKTCVVPRSRLVLLTRALLRQGPDPQLSKSEVSRLADWDAALGFGVKLLTYLEELGFLTTHSETEFGWGRSSDLCVCSTPLAVTCLSSSKTYKFR